ncbi:MAG: BCCT family transporter [Parasporobacterium sp.]|nr:BCCT family transporter [Parasporobacterium sp.]
METNSKSGKLKKGVFFSAAGCLTLGIILIGIFPDQAYEVLTGLLYAWGKSTGWLIELLIFVVFVGGLVLAATKYGNIRIGGKYAKPDYSMFSWITMSICGAIGTGIIFWALGEPIYHYMCPPSVAGVEGGSVEAAYWAVSQTMFHWSFEQFAFYSVPAVVIGLIIFTFKEKVSYDPVANLAVGRECPWLGNLFHFMIVFGMCAGVACSMGVGIMQIGAGIENVAGIGQSKFVWFIIAAVVTFIFVFSAVAGIEKGVKRMSAFTSYAFIFLLLAILVLGPTVFILNNTFENLGIMLTHIPERTFIMNSMYPDDTWSMDWWLQYVGSFVVYGPIIGVFLARIAKGRTIREFILVNTAVSGGFCALWCGIFGSMAIYLQSTGQFDVWKAVQEDGMQSTVYQLLGSLPCGKILIVIFIITVCTSFCTIADPAASALANVTVHDSSIENDPPKKIKMLYGIFMGCLAYVLIASGGQNAVKTVWIIAGVPMMIIIFALIISTLRTVRYVKAKEDAGDEDYKLSDLLQGYRRKKVS